MLIAMMVSVVVVLNQCFAENEMKKKMEFVMTTML